MTANYATHVATVELSGKPVTIVPGAKFDSVTNASLIALWSADFTTTAPVAGTGDVTGIMAQYLASYPSGPQVS